MLFPTVDILMATYEGERYLAEQIESIQRQTYPNWRLLISDDCSLDGTVEIVRSYASSDCRISLVSEGVRYGSAKENFMSLLTEAEAPYIMFCDQDDVWLPDKIETLLNEIEHVDEGIKRKPLLVFSDMKVVDTDLNLISESFEGFSGVNVRRTAFSEVLVQSVGAGCTMLFNQEAAKRALCAKSMQAAVMHDWWITLVCSAFGSIFHVDKPTSLYRQHGNNEVGAKVYSPLNWAFKFDEMRRSVEKSTAQAALFLSTYSDDLSRSQVGAIEQLKAAGDASGALAIYHLVKSACWKSGLRKIGQLIVAAGKPIRDSL